MRIIKRINALLLALALSFAIVPTSAFAAEITFEDVPSGAWYANAVSYVQENNLMSGTSATTFSPNVPMNRAMVATVLWRMAGSEAVNQELTFTDVASDGYYTNAVRWAVSKDILSGYNAQTFGTNDPVTREQLATLLYRYAQVEDGASTVSGQPTFADTGSISQWAVSAVAWAQQTGLINGKPGNLFDPKGNATRAEVATILMNYLSEELPPAPPAADSKSLVVHFSMPETTNPNNMTTEEDNSVVVINGEVLGNTQYVAYLIQENTGADIFRIEPKTPYPTDHSTLVDLAAKEQEENARPELAANVENLDQYDVIFLGYPNWWGDMPMILYTFLENHDLSGKTIIPFNTHGGSGFSDTINTIAKLQPNATVEKNGFTVSRNNVESAEDDVVAWLRELGYHNSGSNNSTSPMQITLTIGDTMVTAELNDSDIARQFAALLPQTISMSRVRDREYYGRIDGTLAYDESDILTTAGNGDLAYWFSGNSLAFFFNTENDSAVNSGIVVFGKITSDLSVFDNMGDSETVTVTLLK